VADGHMWRRLEIRERDLDHLEPDTGRPPRSPVAGLERPPRRRLQVAPFVPSAPRHEGTSDVAAVADDVHEARPREKRSQKWYPQRSPGVLLDQDRTGLDFAA